MLLSAIHVQEVGTADFYTLLNSSDNIVLLDVRVFEEYCESRLPGAIWAGKKAVLDSLLNELDKTATFFIYCDIGDRTKAVSRILKKEKVKHIVELEEGFIAWKRENFPIDKERFCEDE